MEKGLQQRRPVAYRKWIAILLQIKEFYLSASENNAAQPDVGRVQVMMEFVVLSYKMPLRFKHQIALTVVKVP